jgi:hypothetical protein
MTRFLPWNSRRKVLLGVCFLRGGAVEGIGDGEKGEQVLWPASVPYPPPRIFTRGDTYIPKRTQKVPPPPVACAGVAQRSSLIINARLDPVL